ncbi:MAG: lysophospholipid acyltransferase family protein [Desulfobacterota bacterium]|nr:lysophospholipid acyltransferase family protein [Thermodesulfobacteriota bacterium]MDW8002047.1 lysophospholipid acyltransferase family protein [Deltaproteobacteria bacterium]
MFKKIKTFLLLYVFPPLTYVFLRILRKTISVIHVDRDYVLDLWQKTNLIVCFWHGRLLMMPFAYEKKRGKVLISRHRDGEFIARVVKYFNLGTIRGSFKKGGISTSFELIRSLKDGYDIAVTPDGPRGPRYVVKKGILEIAKLTSKPVVPVSYGASKKKLLNHGMSLSCHYLFPR